MQGNYPKLLRTTLTALLIQVAVAGAVYAREV